LTFLISEDEALRKKLQGMTVTDQKSEGDGNPRSVGVWFGQPDQEIRSQGYPYITIDMLDIQRDQAREMRGIVSPWYLDPETPNADGFDIQLPIPVTIDYQITSYARHPRHDRAIVSQLLHEKFPIRFGYLSVDTGKVDGEGNPQHTLRRLDIMDVNKRDVTEQAKRLFVNVITVRVSSEVSVDAARRIYEVTSIDITTPSSYLSLNGGRPGDPYWVGIDEIHIA